MLTPARLLEIAMNLIASNGEANNCGPDSGRDPNLSGTWAFAMWQTIIQAELTDDVVTYNTLLIQAFNLYGP